MRIKYYSDHVLLELNQIDRVIELLEKGVLHHNSQVFDEEIGTYCSLSEVEAIKQNVTNHKLGQYLMLDTCESSTISGNGFSPPGNSHVASWISKLFILATIFVMIAMTYLKVGILQTSGVGLDSIKLMIALRVLCLFSFSLCWYLLYRFSKTNGRMLALIVYSILMFVVNLLFAIII